VEISVSLIGSLLKRSIEKPAVPLTSASLTDLFTGAATSSGSRVTVDSALHVAAVYACVRILSETIGSLPLPLYRRLEGNGKERDSKHPLYALLHDLPNPKMTSMELRENLVGHVALWGTAYCEVERDSFSGRVKGIWPLNPAASEPIAMPDGIGVLTTIGGERLALPATRTWRIRGFGTGAYQGLSVITQARESIGLAQATEEYGARFFGNDSRPGGVLKHPGKLKTDSAKSLKESWETAFGGLSNKHRVAVLEEGVEWQAIGIPPEDAQFLETRKFQITEIARWFRIPPHMLADLERATFSNIEHQSMEFVTHTIRPWLVRIEQSITRDLLTGTERGTWYAEHLVDGLLRGDTLSRYQAYSIGRNGGWLSANDIRDRENMNPIDGGDEYLTPMNMALAGEMEPELESEPAASAEPAARSVAAATVLRARVRVGSESRRRIARSYRRLISEASQRVLHRERADVLRQAEKQLDGADPEPFLRWLDGYYAEDQLPAYVRRVYEPVLLSLSDQIQADAAQQIGSTVGLTDDLEQFVRDYTKTAAFRYGRSSLGQLSEVVRRRQQESEADYLDALEERFGEWDETRPGKLAVTHSVRCNCAITRETWRGGGVVRIEWATFGNNCPWCDSLDGKIVGIEETFAKQGQELKPEGAPSALVPHRDIGHPPVHLACDCGVEPD
jgi:HK97 family phage portal protein